MSWLRTAVKTMSDEYRTFARIFPMFSECVIVEMKVRQGYEI